MSLRLTTHMSSGFGLIPTLLVSTVNTNGMFYVIIGKKNKNMFTVTS